VSAPARASPWILGPRADATFVLGGVVISGAMALAGILGGARTIGWLFLLFQAGFNLPHYFQTFTLTYLDAEMRHRERRRLAILGAASLLLPLGALLAPSATPLRLLTTFTLLWGFWHILQQSWGLTAIYLRRAGTDSPWGRRWARAALTLGCLWPLAWRISRGTLGYAKGGLAQQSLLPPLPIAWANAGAALALCASVGYAGWIGTRLLKRQPAAPLAALLVALTAVQFWVGLVFLDDFVLAIVFLTTWHAVQYLALVFQVQRARGLGAEARVWSRLASSEEVWYFAVAVGFALLAAGLADSLPRPWGDAVYLPLLLAHYLNDGWLWKRKQNPDLGSWLPSPG
jgi:hypothetical protein